MIKRMNKKIILKKICIILLAFFIFAGQIKGQVAVYLDDTSKDLVGQRLVYKIRECIRESNGLNLALIENKSIIQLRIITLDTNSYRTIYSAVWTVRIAKNKTSLYYTHNVGTCESSRITDVAEGIVADTDAIAQDLKELYASLLEDYYKDNKNQDDNTEVYKVLGLQVTDCTKDIAIENGLDFAKGVVIQDIIYNSPASESGLLEGDIILEIENESIFNTLDFKNKFQEILESGGNSALLYILSGKSNYKYIVIKID